MNYSKFGFDKNFLIYLHGNYKRIFNFENRKWLSKKSKNNILRGVKKSIIDPKTQIE